MLTGHTSPLSPYKGVPPGGCSVRYYSFFTSTICRTVTFWCSEVPDICWWDKLLFQCTWPQDSWATKELLLEKSKSYIKIANENGSFSILERKDRIKYLGVLPDETVFFRHHISYDVWESQEIMVLAKLRDTFQLFHKWNNFFHYISCVFNMIVYIVL